MRRFIVPKAKASSVKNNLVLSLVSFVLAVPLLSLPLGLTNIMAATAPVITSADVATVESLPVSVSAVEPLIVTADSADFTDISLNRSQLEISQEVRVDVVEDRIEVAMAAATEPSSVEVDYDVYIRADVLNVRAEATTVEDIVAKMTMGDRVHAIAEFGDWLQIEADDQIGFIKAEYASTDMVFRPVSETLYVKGTSLNVRDEYSTDGEILASLDSGSKVKRTGIGDEWSQIELSDGQTGYVASKFLTKSSDRTASTDINSNEVSGSASNSDAEANSSGNSIVDLAFNALGTPYVYGSESLKGMDCSGLVYWAYNQVGVSVPRSSSSFGSAGEGVSLDNAQPGDVLCIDARPGDGKSRITHVAIYIGGGQVIHASTSQRRVVKASVQSFLNVDYSILSVRRFPN